MQNTILEMILDEIHKSTNGQLKLLKVLDKEIIRVNVDYKLFLVLDEILSFIKPIQITEGTVEKVYLFPDRLTIKLPGKATVDFILSDYQPYFTFQIMSK